MDWKKEALLQKCKEVLNFNGHGAKLFNVELVETGRGRCTALDCIIWSIFFSLKELGMYLFSSCNISSIFSPNFSFYMRMIIMEVCLYWLLQYPFWLRSRVPSVLFSFPAYAVYFLAPLQLWFWLWFQFCIPHILLWLGFEIWTPFFCGARSWQRWLICFWSHQL